MTEHADDISVVIPTYNRDAALRANFPYVLALDDVSEIVVVVDGANDDTKSVLSGFNDSRVRVIEHGARRGSQAARLTGRRAAHGEWILMLDDDAAVPPDFASILVGTARRLHADIVGAPWLHLKPGSDPEAEIAARRAHPSPTISLKSHPMTFPADDLETPFLPGNAVLINARVFDRVGYDEGLTRNAWREETSFYLDAAAAGFRVVLTPRTASFQMEVWEGGQRAPRLQYEWYVVRNNWRFLWRHRGDLRARGEISGPVRAEIGFAWGRASGVARGYLGARARALRAITSGS